MKAVKMTLVAISAGWFRLSLAIAGYWASILAQIQHTPAYVNASG